MQFPLVTVLASVASAAFGAAVAVGVVGARRWFRKRARVAAVKEFFGLPGKVIIVHSAVFDPPEQAWNYPATDTKSARALATVFESSGLREGVHFTVEPDRRIVINDELWRHNLVLLCGPARNSVLEDLAPSMSMSMRYTMTVDGDGENLLTDHERETRLLSSREAPSSNLGNYDYGLIASLPNPRHPQRRVVLLAGIHGTGTVGAAGFVTDAGNLRTLNGRRTDGIVSEVVRVDYADDIETPTRTRLV